jgi:hypothetical protein
MSGGWFHFAFPEKNCQVRCTNIKAVAQKRKQERVRVTKFGNTIVGAACFAQKQISPLMNTDDTHQKVFGIGYLAVSDSLFRHRKNGFNLPDKANYQLPSIKYPNQC